MIDSLAQLHTAIVSGLRAKLDGVPTVEAYPVLQRRIGLPAVLVELAEMEPGNDPGNGATALIGRFQARAIVDPNAAQADLQVRELAARVAVALTHEGITTNCFAALDEDSTLTELQPGDNVLSLQAESGASYLRASVSFYPMEAGILPEPL